MTTLVTGAIGFIGEALCREVQHRALAFRAARRSPGSGANQILIGSVGANADWREALMGCETVIHLAALAHRPVGRETRVLPALRATNVDGVLNLAQQAADAGVRRFVFISSVKVNGEATLPGQVFTAADVPAPLDAYGVSKMEAEQGLRHIAEQTLLGLHF